MDFADIEFKRIDNTFVHNLKSDFGCIAIWKSAIPYLDRIRDLITSNFEILLETEMVWSKQHFHSNAARLYQEAFFVDKINDDSKYNHTKKIGDNKFILFVIEDKAPNYTYAMSVSKKIELSNLNIVRVKYQIRDWVFKDHDIKYAVHSTNNIYEFFHQAPLILGLDLFHGLLKGNKYQIPQINQDLQGANGWESWVDVFKILNATCNYLVLRGFEELPNSNPEKDLDVLTDNFQLLASVLGVKQKSKTPYKGFLFVENEQVSIDIRFIGDKYYDTAWSKEMLLQKKTYKRLYIPREDHYFFSLLFHAKVQKPSVKEKYKIILETIAKNLSFEWYKTDMIDDDKIIGKLLSGYCQTHNYFYEDPIDKGVYKNHSIIKYLPTPKDYFVKETNSKKIRRKLKKILPKNVIELLKQIK